jgi:hypothetical protein
MGVDGPGGGSLLFRHTGSTKRLPIGVGRLGHGLFEYAYDLLIQAPAVLLGPSLQVLVDVIGNIPDGDRGHDNWDR